MGVLIGLYGILLAGWLVLTSFMLIQTRQEYRKLKETIEGCTIFCKFDGVNVRRKNK